MNATLRRLFVSPARNLDLVVLWLVSVVGHALVPLGHPLARPDLVPWITLWMAGVALLRGRTLGEAHHPSLSPRGVSWAALAERAALGATPVVLAAWYDAGAGRGREVLYLAVGTTLLVLALAVIGRLDAETPWRPPAGRLPLVYGVRALAVIASAAALGRAGQATDGEPLQWLAISGLLGVQFLAVGLLPDRLLHRAQRRAAGRRDGGRYRPQRFRFAVAALGPSFGLVLLVGMHEFFVGGIGFGEGIVVSLHVIAWAAVIWAPRIPVAVSCVLHEVVPAAGKDPGAKGGTVGFDQPPRGALRLDPRGVRRLRILHHWVVDVRDPRIEDLDDPVRSLWSRRALPASFHVLGEAAFEPDPETQIPQWHTITVRLEDQRDVARLADGNVQTRRLVVLRPYRSRGPGPDAPRTYRWDPEVPPGTLQVVDATTDRISLRDGDIVVLSTEGVARAFELEIGAAIYDAAELGHQRPPQLEDYVGVS